MLIFKISNKSLNQHQHHISDPFLRLFSLIILSPVISGYFMTNVLNK